jgi:Lrp/AsnC family transcriptional regulator of ectoine degradation
VSSAAAAKARADGRDPLQGMGMMLHARPSLSLDAFDLQILAALQADGRMTKVRLAELIGLSPTPCGSRIERLEKMGLITGYYGDIDLARLANLNRFRVTVEIKESTPPKIARFEAAILKVPNIVECEAVLGDIDYIMTVVASSISHYQEIIGSLLSGVTDEVDYTTYPVSKPIKRPMDVPLLKLSSQQEQS